MRSLRRHERPLANLLIGAGVLVIAGSGTLTRIGDAYGFVLGAQLAGLVMIYAGFELATQRAPRAARPPRRRRRSEPDEHVRAPPAAGGRGGGADRGRHRRAASSLLAAGAASRPAESRPIGTGATTGGAERGRRAAARRAPSAHASSSRPGSRATGPSGSCTATIVQRIAPPYRKGRVALTFDDGPGPYTREVLAELQSLHARATFFLIGRNVKESPEMVRELRDGRHGRSATTPGRTPT